MDDLRFRRTWLVTAITTAVVIVAIGTYLIGTYRSAEAMLERSLGEVFQLSRPTAGRLSDAPYAPYVPNLEKSAALNRAQLLLLTLPAESQFVNQFEAYVDIASHRWKNATNTLERLVSGSPSDPALANDLGVAYMELGLEDPSYLIEVVPIGV